MSGPLRAALALPLLLSLGCTHYAFETLQVEAIPSEEVAIDLFLIGDSGAPHTGGEPVLMALKAALAVHPERSYVVYLGDNLYPAGLADTLDAEAREIGEAVLRAQIEPLDDNGVRGIFVPGNHDWQAGGPGGLETLLRQQRFIEQNAEDEGIEFLPKNGCPGPEVRDVGDVLRVVALDTQWWLQIEGPKPVDPTSDCLADSPAEVIDAIQQALAGAGDRVTVVVGHHPTLSGGEHGGYFDWPAYLFPPYPWARRLGYFAPQDVNSRQYVTMRQSLEEAFSTTSPTIYAAGHEHNLQLLNGIGARYLVVSGSGIFGHLTPVRVIPQSIFARDVSGFIRLSIRPDHWSRLAVIEVDGTGKMTETYSFWIEPRAAGPAP